MRRTGEGVCTFCGERRVVHSAMEYRPAGVDLLVASICWPCAKLAVTTIEQLTGKDGK